MLIFDAHLDMAWNAVEWNRDLMKPAAEIRAFEQHFPEIVPGDCTTSWVELRRGQIGITICTLLPRLHRKHGELTFYQSREADYGAAYGQLAYYRAMVARGELRELPDWPTLQKHVEEWETHTGTASLFGKAENSQPPHSTATSDRPPIGFILSMEGSQPILHPEQIHEWFAAGLRILGPAHYGENPYCFGTGSEGGLKAEGPALLKAMSSVGMLLDVTHLADQSFWEALEIYEGPVLASHHNCRTLVPGDRQLTDEQVRAVADRGGVIGAAFDCWMIKPGWKKYVTDPATITMEDIANHTDHICQLLGTTRHCGIGTDLDGGFGKEQSPGDLDTIAELGKFADVLARRGYSAEDIQGILYQNYVRFFERAWT